MELLEWECNVCLCRIKPSHKLIVMYNENEILTKIRLSTRAMKQPSLLKQMAKCFYWGPSLLGAEFVRGQVCQEPSLSGAEMSRNPKKEVSTGTGPYP